MIDHGVEKNGRQDAILFVDDDSSMVDIWSTLLERAGYRVLPAQNGAQALPLFVAETVDAVILDYEMSGMSGATVATRIRRIQSGVPIILLSSIVTITEEDLALFDCFIPKDNCLDTLLPAIESALIGVRKPSGKKYSYCPGGESRLKAVAHAGRSLEKERMKKQWFAHLGTCEHCAYTHQVINAPTD